MTKLIEKLETIRNKVKDFSITDYIFDAKYGFTVIRVVEGICIGLMASIVIATTSPSPKAQVIQVPVVKVIEKPVIVKVPVKLSANDQQQVQCLAENIYFEAGNQPDKGKVAVSNVVMNRTRDDRFAGTPCGVVKEKHHGVCQFSWVCGGHKKIHDWALYDHSKQIAANVYLHNYGDVTRGATFYHANYVRPAWSHHYTKVAMIGAHIFYRG